jgi:hypothetical protein
VPALGSLAVGRLDVEDEAPSKTAISPAWRAHCT